MESLNSNEFSNEIEECPTSPVLNSSKINRRLRISKKRSKSKVKPTNQSLNNKQLNADIVQDNSAMKNKLRTIEVLENERRRYYSEMCSKFPGIKTVQIAESNCNIKNNLLPQQYFKSVKSNAEYNYSIPQNIAASDIQTASGKKVEIPENIIAEHKYIFDDILNGDQLLNPAVLKYPMKEKMKVSRIPIFNRNTKLKNGNIYGNISTKDSNAKAVVQQCDTIKKLSNEQLIDSLALVENDKENMLRSSSSDMTVIESNIMDPKGIRNRNQILNEVCLPAKYLSSLDTMNKLYSNQKFEECSSSTNSFENCLLTEPEGLGSELNIELLQTMSSTIIEPCSNSNMKYTNQIIKITPDDFTDVSIMDTINDDWSDTFFGDNEIKTAMSLDNQNNGNSKVNMVSRDNEVVSSAVTAKTVDIPSNNEQIANENMFTEQVGNYKLVNQFTGNNLEDNQKLDVSDNHSYNSHPVETKPTKEGELAVRYKTEQKLYDQQSVISSSKSLIHVSIPAYRFDCEEEHYSKNLIELHRNKNFTGYSEDSVSNLEYKLSHHTMQMRKRILRTQKKFINTDFSGFDKKTQNIANEKALAFSMNLKEIEKQIYNTEAVIYEHSKESKKKDKKKKKQKPTIHNEKENEREKDQHFPKETKIKPDKKKKEKLKEKREMEEFPENCIKQIVPNEKTNKMIPNDHVSIASEQYNKKYKGHNKRKTTTIDKELVHENQNINQVIELSPNNKKFKIEIDCNSKFRINICCNGTPNIYEPGCDKDNRKGDREAIKFDTENVGINLKPTENFKVKAMFTSASGKDIMMNKALLVDAERKLEQIDSNSPNAKENGVENSHGKTTTTEQNKKCNDARSLNVNNRDKLIKKFMDKAHKLYHDVQKSDASLNRDKIENSIDNDLNTNYLSKLNKNIQDTTPNDFCGFKLASGKDMKISEKAFKNAQKMYQDIDEISVKNWIKGNTNETSVIQNVKNVSPKSKRTKQKTQITHGNIDSCNPNEKVDHVITGKLAKNKNNTRHKDVSLKINEAQNGKNQLTSVEMTNFSCGFKSAGGKNINISPAALEKAKRLFDDNRPAGDSTHQTLLFSNFENTCNTKTDAPEKHVSESYAKGDNTKFCMGDFENDNDTKKQSDANNTPLNASGSKRAFELLEDVVETVDYALEKIKKGKLHKPSNVKRRLGISRCKQINISKEKIDKAKRLFSNENFTDTIRDLSVMTTPKVSNITANSTPIKDNAPQIRDVRFSMNTIESEITPIKNSSVDKNSDMVAQSGSVIIKNRTPGTLDDWYATVLKQINTLKDTLKGLENKKSYLEKQMSFVHYGDKEHKRQRVGVLYEKKMSNSSKLHLKSVEIDDSSNVQNVINDVTSKNADMIHFNSISSEYSGRTEDGAIIIPNAQNLVGLSEIEIAFRTMVGVEPSLIPDGWIVNHYRLIVWKLASYERFFSGQLSGCLTIENIVQQLKYRYDREIDRAQRPAIRKILEKDDVSQKRMVLCVSDIIEVPNNGIELELTDGWYSIRTLIDNPLIAAVRRKKIRIGTKLLTCGAQLLNCDGCHPLQITDFVKLKISYNCTRRAVWYAKLGYQKCPEPFAISLSSIHPNGGVIGCIKVHILRIYPIRYMEQVDDKKVWRNTRAEEKYANSFENDRLEKIEKIHYSVHEKFQRDLCSDLKSKYIDQSTLNIGEILKITCPKTLYSLLESSNDPDSLMEVLLPSQRVSILEYRQQVCLQQEQEISKRISEEMEKLKLNKRKVTPILKLLVLDDCYKSEKPRQFCIWNPKEDDMSLLKEGFSISVYNVVPRFNGDLFSNAKTYFKINKINTSYAKFKRQVSPISMVLDPSYKPLFNEFDTVGLVVQININTHDQNLWITDIRGIMLLIKIRDGPALCSLLEGIMKCQIISLSNLIYCKPQKDFGLAFANQFTIITASPQQGHLQDGIQLLKSKLPEDLSQLVKQCELDIERHMAKIDLKQSFFNPSNLTTSLNNSFNISDDNTLATSRLTPIDVAMSLIDTDKFG